MKYLVFVIALLVAFPISAKTLAERLAELRANNKVEHAEITEDAKDVPKFEGKLKVAEITYYWKDGDVMHGNTVEVRITGFGTPQEKARWSDSVPDVLRVAEEAARTPAVGTHDEIVGAINSAQGIVIGKADIDRKDTYADVTTYVETEGKWVKRMFYVARNIKDNTWTVKEYSNAP